MWEKWQIWLKFRKKRYLRLRGLEDLESERMSEKRKDIFEEESELQGSFKYKFTLFAEKQLKDKF